MNTLFIQQRGNSINPERITEAREAKGINMADLARLLDVSRQAVSAFEKGLKKPSSETLSQLSKTLGFPEHFFLSDTTSPQIKSAIHFRSRSTASKKERLVGKTKGRWVSLILNEIMNYVTLPTPEIPEIDIPDFELLSNADIEDIATNVRRTWGLGDGPITNLTMLLENKGIIVANIHSGEKVDAFSFWNEHTPVIVIDKMKTAVRTRFSIAHELGHLVMHRAVEDDYIDDPSLFKLVESQANYFASCFLMPASTFGREYYSSNIDSLMKLKKRWLTSIGAIAIRAYNLNLINDNQKIYIFQQIAPYKRREPLDDILVREEPRLINKIVNLIDSHDILSKRELYEKLGLPNNDFLTMTKLSLPDIMSDESSNVVSISINKK
ncbi:helix-turn-helix domain-containing protein [Morganella morganii]|uniref:helix-turn-helix domain-containing protein n=1 Tax=Morganella morganii TaxID=582 RepID=UPI002367EF0B|nr:XRE family transcriptional regulator [Morganella morganii]